MFKKFPHIILIVLVLPFFLSAAANASLGDCNIENATLGAKLIVEGTVVKISEEGKSPRGKGTIGYTIKIESITKNELNENVPVGSEYYFLTYAPVKLIKDKKYLLFIKEYPDKMKGFMCGEHGILEIKGDEAVNKYNNSGIMTGVDPEITAPVSPSAADGAGPKSVHIKKSVNNRKEIMDLIEQIEMLKKQKGSGGE